MLMVALLLQSAQPAPAAPMSLPPLHGGPQETVCPVGGERFPAWRASMYSTFGERPDGKPYSYLSFPFPLPECPTNKLIVFDDYSASEKTALAALIATDEYRELAATETTYYRAYWLATRLGRLKPQALGLLLSAVWQVSPDGMSAAATKRSNDQMRRYQKTFIDEVRSLGSTVETKDRLWLTARAANALRQSELFSEAEQMRKEAEALLSGVAPARGWDAYLANLGIVIARRDAGVEPLDMIPEQQIAFACVHQQRSSGFDRAVCARPEVASRIEEFRRVQSQHARAR